MRRRARSAAIAAAATLFFAIGLRGQSGPADVEEATDVARRAAFDLLRSSQARLFSEALDADTILVRRLGATAWSALTERQKDGLRAAVHERFIRTLTPTGAATSDIAWSSAEPGRNAVLVSLGLRFDGKVLKTRWMMRRLAGGWRIADVILVDPGVSLAHAAEEALGRRPVARRTQGEELWTTIFPRAATLVAIGILVAILSIKIPRAKRPLLYWTALAPVALLTVDAVLAVNLTLSEPYSVSPQRDTEGWRRSEQLALAAERDGNLDTARAHFARALASGAPAAPIEYEIGLAEKRHGSADRARAEFTRALAEPEPAPGAARELASLEVAGGRFAAAEPLLLRYIALAGPDPESLSLLAVVQTNLGKNADALETIRRARSLVAGAGWRGEELEAQIYARSGDAAGTVAALRPLETQGLLDRSALRADASYMPIATDPVWVAFLNEKPKTAVPGK